MSLNNSNSSSMYTQAEPALQVHAEPGSSVALDTNIYQQHMLTPYSTHVLRSALGQATPRHGMPAGVPRLSVEDLRGNGISNNSRCLQWPRRFFPVRRALGFQPGFQPSFQRALSQQRPNAHPQKISV